MSQNIEIKATVPDAHVLKSKLIQYGLSEDCTMHQKDIFYHFPFGRLKLRSINENQHEIIIYFRRNKETPKASKYFRMKIGYPDFTNRILTNLFGARGIVEKERVLFLKNNIRFHVDTVKNLGTYFEIEYIVEDAKDEQKAYIQVKKLLNTLGILDSQLIRGSYIDILSKSTRINQDKLKLRES